MPRGALASGAGGRPPSRRKTRSIAPPTHYNLLLYLYWTRVEAAPARKTRRGACILYICYSIIHAYSVARGRMRRRALSLTSHFIPTPDKYEYQVPTALFRSPRPISPSGPSSVTVRVRRRPVRGFPEISGKFPWKFSGNFQRRAPRGGDAPTRPSGMRTRVSVMHQMRGEREPRDPASDHALLGARVGRVHRGLER